MWRPHARTLPSQQHTQQITRTRTRTRTRTHECVPILNSSVMSAMNPVIDFISRSTFASTPVFKRVVMARVAMFRLLSVSVCSRSTEQVWLTKTGWRTTTWLSVLTAANLCTGSWEVRKSASTWTAGVIRCESRYLEPQESRAPKHKRGRERMNMGLRRLTEREKETARVEENHQENPY